MHTLRLQGLEKTVTGLLRLRGAAGGWLVWQATHVARVPAAVYKLQTQGVMLTSSSAPGTSIGVSALTSDSGRARRAPSSTATLTGTNATDGYGNVNALAAMNAISANRISSQSLIT